MTDQFDSAANDLLQYPKSFHEFLAVVDLFGRAREIVQKPGEGFNEALLRTTSEIDAALAIFREVWANADAGRAAPSTPENAGGVPASGEAEPTIREQTLAGLVKRLAWLAPKDHAARIAATECLQRYGYLSPLRADVSGVGAVVSQTPPPLGTDGGTPQ